MTLTANLGLMTSKPWLQPVGNNLKRCPRLPDLAFICV
jgi:hypothetical protein